MEKQKGFACIHYPGIAGQRILERKVDRSNAINLKSQNTLKVLGDIAKDTDFKRPPTFKIDYHYLQGFFIELGQRGFEKFINSCEIVTSQKGLDFIEEKLKTTLCKQK